jgi:hypothetical protein
MLKTVVDPTLPPFRVQAYGAGVQSSALMMLWALEEPMERADGTTWRGFFPQGRPDLVAFADTGAEPSEIYANVEMARALVEAAGVRFEVVTNGDLANPPKASTGTQGIFVPLFTVSTEGRWEPHTTPVDPFNLPRWIELRDMLDARADATLQAEFNAIPTEETKVWVPPGEHGQLRRQCTSRYKIEPIVALSRSLAGNRPIEMWLALSSDELQRLKTSPSDSMQYYYPLVFDQENAADPEYYEYAHLAPVNRSQCAQYLVDLETKPAKSACVFCPYRSEWSWARQRADDPVSFEQACQYDERMRDVRPGYKLYVHRSRIPLRDVVFEANDVRTLALFDDVDMSQSGGCEEGYCGL